MSSVTVSTSVCGHSKPSVAVCGLKTRTSERPGERRVANSKMRERGARQLPGVARRQVLLRDAVVVAAHEALRQLPADRAAARAARDALDQRDACGGDAMK